MKNLPTQDYLDKEILEYLYNKKWEKFTNIQDATIKFFNTKPEYNFIVVSPTSSGKTEAIFLPILSDNDIENDSITVLYISPLKALINDQFNRIEEIANLLDIKVTKWHGDANASAKNNLKKNPKGILIITPESLEGILKNNLNLIPKIFKFLKYIVIDEIHYFIGNDRGNQLRSQIERIIYNLEIKPRCFGLSATIDIDENLTNFFQNKKETKIIRDTSILVKKLKFLTLPIEDEDENLNPATEIQNVIQLNQIMELIYNKYTLIFPNSKFNVETLGNEILNIVTKNDINLKVFTHHGSLSKEIREDIEFFAKNSNFQPFVIIATSTLELGIDIGSIDQVIQIGGTNSLNSLTQRLGRSGRREGKIPTLFQFNEFKIIEEGFCDSNFCFSLSTFNLIEKNEKDINLKKVKPYNILFHQMLSIIDSYSSVNKNNLINHLKKINFFNQFTLSDIEEIINFSIENDILENIGNNEILIGSKFERFINSFSFFSVFVSNVGFKCYSSNKLIGELNEPPVLNESITLNARSWRVIEVNLDKKRVNIIPTSASKAKKYNTDVRVNDEKILNNLVGLLKSENISENWNDKTIDSIKKTREIVDLNKSFIRNQDLKFVFDSNKLIKGVYHFLNSETVNTLDIILNILAKNNLINSQNIQSEYLFMKFKNISKEEIVKFTKNALEYINESNLTTETMYLNKRDAYLFKNIKFQEFLSERMKNEIYIQNVLNLEGLINFLNILKNKLLDISNPAE